MKRNFSEEVVKNYYKVVSNAVYPRIPNGLLVTFSYIYIYIYIFIFIFKVTYFVYKLICHIRISYFRVCHSSVHALTRTDQKREKELMVDLWSVNYHRAAGKLHPVSLTISFLEQAMTQRKWSETFCNSCRKDSPSQHNWQGTDCDVQSRSLPSEHQNRVWKYPAALLFHCTTH